MSTQRLKEPWQSASPAGPCTCAQLRRTARKVSSLYDAILKPCGLTNTQHSLLVNIGRAGEISRTALAERLGMERTTLTRNLSPLEKSNLIASVESDDRREHLLRLSPEGARKLRRSYALWEKAQQAFETQLGAGLMKQLRAALTAAEDAIEITGRGRF